MSDWKISTYDANTLTAELLDIRSDMVQLNDRINMAGQNFANALTEIKTEPEPTPEPDALPTLNYLGQFGVPETDGVDDSSRHTYGWGGSAFSVRSATMYLATHDHAQWVGTVVIPGSFPGMAYNVGYAVDMLKPIRDAAGGGIELAALDHKPGRPTIVLGTDRYNVSAERHRCFGLYSLDGSTGGPIGLQINGTRLQSQCYGRGFCRGASVNEYYTLGGGLPGQGATGYGPMVHRVFIDRHDRMSRDIPAARVISYMDEANPAPEWDFASRPMAIERIGNWLMVLCTVGFGEVWYGGPDDPNSDAYDERKSSKSFHADEYQLQAWWYRIPDDPAAVWDHTPIITSPPAPVTMGSANQGLRLCRDGNRLYILRRNSSADRYDRTPIVYVFEIA